jgi:SAM-dependent methyltransferase
LPDAKYLSARLSELARETTPFFADVWDRQEKEFGARWKEEVSENVLLLLGGDEDRWKDALFGYADFSMEAIREQNFFEQYRRYRNSSASELLANCYEDENFMMTTYLPGLFLSHFLWKHHYRLLLFFRNEVLPDLRSPEFFYEIGVGTGLYSREMLRAFPSVSGKGIDISRHSLEFTKRFLDLSGVLPRYAREQMDIFKTNLRSDTADFVICQEVLEHLEHPEKLCSAILSLVKPGAKAYITAAINAAHTDHIYLFRTESEVEAMLRSTGWKILKSRAEYAYEGKSAEITPCVAAFLCQKA